MDEFPYNRRTDAGAQSTEIDYGDIPDNMNEQDMRAYLALESKLVMPNQKKRDSFEKQWNDGRSKYDNHSTAKQQNSNIGFVPPPPQQMNFAFQKQPKPQPQYNPNMNPNPNPNPNTHTFNQTPQTNTTAASSVYGSDYHHNIDRMSTVTIISQKGNHRRQHSFKKQQIPQTGKNPNLPPLSQSNPNNRTAQFPPNTNTNGHTNGHTAANTNNTNNTNDTKSILTAQIAPQKHHLANQNSGQQSGVIQSRNAKGLLVVKQMPYSKKSHVCLHVFVEIQSEHTEHIIVYFQKHFSVTQFLDLLKNETNNAAFVGSELQIFCADEDGDIDDDFPAPEPTSIIANLGLQNFYIRLVNEMNEKQRDEMRRSTIAHKSQLLSTQEMDKIHNIDEEDYEDYDSQDEDEGCKCIVL